MNTNEILTKFGLDFTINKLPLSGTDETGSTFLTPYFGLFHSKTKACINTAKAGYHVTQNRDFVNMILSGCKDKNLSVTNAGSLNEGRGIFIHLLIDGVATVGDKTLTRYVTAIDSNDGSTSLCIGIGFEVMGDENLFFEFFPEGQAKFRHTATIEQKIESIPKLIGIALNESTYRLGLLRQFNQVKLTDNMVDTLVKKVIGFNKHDEIKKQYGRAKNMMLELYDIIKNECEGKEASVFHLFNGLIKYTTHNQIAPNRENGKIEGLMVGAAYEKAEIGLRVCKSFCAI